jgi:hypothetical protein
VRSTFLDFYLFVVVIVLVGFGFTHLFFFFYYIIYSSDELVRLRSQKPHMGERRVAESIPDRLSFQVFDTASLCLDNAANADNSGEETKSKEETDKPQDETTDDSPKPEANAKEAREEVAGQALADDCGGDDDSKEAVGKQEAAEQDRDMMDDEAEAPENEELVETTNSKVSTMFQKIMSLGSQAGQVVMSVGAEVQGKCTLHAPSPGRLFFL